MATGPENSWWWDVLQNGPSSRFAGYFDIDWHGPESRLRNKVLLPVLGNHYGRVLEAGDIRLVRFDAVFQVHSPGQVFPVTPAAIACSSCPTISSRGGTSTRWIRRGRRRSA